MGRGGREDWLDRARPSSVNSFKLQDVLLVFAEFRLLSTIVFAEDVSAGSLSLLVSVSALHFMFFATSS